jgi:hypothetical protein
MLSCKLYFLTPYPNDITYNNYMNNYFKLDSWDEFKNSNIEFVYINKCQNIEPNYDNDYLLVCDIQNINIKNYYDKYIYLFKKKNRFVFIYECLMHKTHMWKIKYVKDNFHTVFQNSHELVGDNIFWIPCWSLFIRHDYDLSEKKLFCAVSPIFDLGLSIPIDDKRIERIKIIKKYCQNNKNIHVYGHEDWEKYIPLINYLGMLPNESQYGLYGNVNLEEKIKNKCKLLSKYKFVLVFESLFVDGFVTEKLVEALYSNSVVIYYGPKNIKNMYGNLFDNGVINGHDYDVIEMITLMKNMNDDEYNLRVNKIQLLRDEINYANSSENVKCVIMSKIMEMVNHMC